MLKTFILSLLQAASSVTYFFKKNQPSQASLDIQVRCTCLDIVINFASLAHVGAVLTQWFAQCGVRTARSKVDQLETLQLALLCVS